MYHRCNLVYVVFLVAFSAVVEPVTSVSDNVEKANVHRKGLLNSLVDFADGTQQSWHGGHAHPNRIVTIPVLVPSKSYMRYFESKLPERSKLPCDSQVEAKTPNRDAHAAGKVFAVSLIASTVLISIGFSMASSSNLEVSCITWITIDNVVTVFIAILWFKAIDEALEYSEKSIGTFLKVWLAYIIAAVILAVAILFSYAIRKNKLQLAIFCGCSTEFAAFVSMLGSTEIMQEYFSSHPSTYLFGFAIQIFVLVVLVLALSWFRKVAMYDDDKDWSNRADLMENEFAAMALAVTWSLFVRFFVCGAYAGWESSPHQQHNETERMVLLLYVLCLAPLGGCVLWLMSRLRARTQYSYVVHRGMLFVEAFCVDCIAWGFIFWGQWQLVETHWADEPVVGRIYFALIASISSCLAITVLAPHMGAGRMSLEMVVSGLSVLIAWSWEESFDEALDVIEGKPFPLCKLASAAVLTLVILPVYANSLKPLALQRRADLSKVEGSGSYLTRSTGQV